MFIQHEGVTMNIFNDIFIKYRESHKPYYKNVFLNQIICVIKWNNIQEDPMLELPYQSHKTVFYCADEDFDFSSVCNTIN